MRSRPPRPVLIGTFQAELDGRPVSYTLKKSARARQARLEMGQDGLNVVLPRGGSPGDAPALLEKYRRWILQKLDNYARGMAALKPGHLAYLGQEYPLAIVPDGHGRGYIRLASDRLEVTANRSGDKLRENLEAWYREQARAIFTARSATVCEKLGLSFNRISIRDQRTRWGSCSSRGNLNFNWRIIMAPPEVVDYIVAHEVAHLRERSHDRRYWALVAGCCPDWAAQRRWLRENGFRLVGGLRSISG